MIGHILDKIEEYETVIIHRHERPDPDALGSQVGFATILKDTFPTKNIFVVGEEEPSLQFLARMDVVEDALFKGALVIVCDTANTERISDERYKLGSFVIKIDHHPNEDPYGDLLWVKTEASSTSEMIVELYEEAKERGYILSSEAALLLYAGIVGDTGRFRYPSTKASTHQCVSLLLERGVDQNEFYSNLYKKDLKMSRLEGYVLQHFTLLDSGLAIMNLPKTVLEEFGVTANETSQVINAFADVEGVIVWVFFVEDEEANIRVRLRSKGPTINQIAQKHNGGGHPLASGAKAANWEETEEIIKELQEVCLNYKK
ncbi:DHH family phosphoesterase [Bacillus alkalicellulosilyticus]|uniref:DHH family phosphoesterase n=1 Tax=Alkalihalobacterium alkalicellulosilyticum TaxID=1912214 RepID=UPI000995FAB8|nr:bifunctional oligoribonuclease/PAP phosphatase NrnA [Bacillus alkalicellulosilyticus]